MRCLPGFKETFGWLCCHFFRERHLVEDFKKCCELVAIRRAAGDIPDEDFWNLYGYFKQAVVGDFNITDTSEATESELLKWAYWKKKKGISKKDAMAAYIDIVKSKYGDEVSVEEPYPRMSSAYSRINLEEPGPLPPEVEGFLTLAADNRVGMLDLLLKAKPYLIESKSEGDVTALHIAADRGHVEVAKCLLKHGANIDAMDEHSDTPLLVAAAAEHKPMVQFLISKGASVEMKNIDGVGFHDLLPDFKASKTMDDAYLK